MLACAASGDGVGAHDASGFVYRLDRTHRHGSSRLRILARHIARPHSCQSRQCSGRHDRRARIQRRTNAASAEGRAKWNGCISKKFRWQTAWAAQASQVDLGFESCRLFGIPLKLRGRRDDWCLWWVPLPHIGGDPLTEFSAKISVLASPCQARSSDIYD